jgi:polysaccharide pyruvyl transferase
MPLEIPADIIFREEKIGMRILYYNNCWFTNVGEAFIDIGAMELLRQAVPDVRIANISNMSSYYVKNIPRGKLMRPIRYFLDRTPFIPEHSIYSAARDFDADVVVMAGMIATREFLAAGSCAMIRKLAERGVRVVLIGVGGVEYSEKEYAPFRRFLHDVNVAGVISRDPQTWDNYQNDVPFCFPGVDCAFWVSDAYDPRGFVRNEYDLVSFCRSKEPKIFKNWPRDIIRPYHFQSSANLSHLRKNMLISDSPYDYLTVYANAHEVHTDLVHGAIASLVYGVPVKYYHDSPRSQVFQSFDELTTDNEGFMQISESHREQKKSQMLTHIRTILESI